MRRSVLAALFVALSLSLAPIAWAEPVPEPHKPDETPGLLGPRLRDALQNLSKAVTDVIRNLPRYEAPRMLDNGDIVIRRLPPTRPEMIDPRDSRPGSRKPIAV